MKLEVLDAEDKAVFDALVAGVRSYNVENMGSAHSRTLIVIARDAEGTLQGGVAGRTIYRQFLIDVVWVDEKARGAGLGRKLMGLAEIEARSRDCLAAQVDTLSFQAPAFYGKLGFETAGSVTDFAESPDRYFLLKRYRPG